MRFFTRVNFGLFFFVLVAQMASVEDTKDTDKGSTSSHSTTPSTFSTSVSTLTALTASSVKNQLELKKYIEVNRIPMPGKPNHFTVVGERCGHCQMYYLYSECQRCTCCGVDCITCGNDLCEPCRVTAVSVYGPNPDCLVGVTARICGVCEPAPKKISSHAT